MCIIIGIIIVIGYWNIQEVFPDGATESLKLIYTPIRCSNSCNAKMIRLLSEYPASSLSMKKSNSRACQYLSHECLFVSHHISRTVNLCLISHSSELPRTACTIFLVGRCPIRDIATCFFTVYSYLLC